MPEIKQYVMICREDWKPLLDAANQLIHDVMSAGEQQRLHDDLPTDQWKSPDVKRYMHHAFMHLVSCKTHEGIHGHPFVLADNTSLEEYKHTLVDLLIIAAAEAKPDNQGVVVESPDD